LTVIAALMLAGAARAETIELAYPEEPSIDQGPGRFAFDYLRAAEMVANDSGLTVHWVSLPNARSIHRLTQGEANFCLSGAGILPERRELGKFTEPFITDRMIGVLTLKSHRAALDRAHSLAELIASEKGDFLLYNGFNYGDQMSGNVAALRRQGRVSEVAHNTFQMLDMLKAGRVDYALVSQSYVANYLAARPEGGDFVLHSFSDMRRDFHLAFLCSKTTSDEVMAKLDQAIRRQTAAIQARFPDQAK
jgi:ABC-type amino acid transport substrate-binding protein